MKRIKSIDIVKCFAIFLVVYIHVVRHGIIETGTNLSHFIYLFIMPLFFMISGFIIGISHKEIKLGNLKQILIKKTTSLLIPTILFFIIYHLLNHRNPLDFFSNFGFGIFWFTYILFWYEALYYILNFIFGNKLQKLFDITLIVISIIGIFVIISVANQQSKIFNILCLGYGCEFFQFFVFGILLGKYKQYVYHFSKNNILTFLYVSLLLNILIIYYPNIFSRFGLLWEFFNRISIKYIILLIIYSLVLKFNKNLGQDTKIKKRLQYIGRNTLAIYMLHIFFIPQIPQLNNLIQQNILLEIIIVGALSISIITICLLVSKIIEQSKLLSHILLGK